MDNRLNGKVVIVTGGTQGMGEQHARTFANYGAKVILTGTSVERGDRIAEEIGASAMFLKHDVASEAEWNGVVANAEAMFGPVNALVNNAGIAEGDTIEEITAEMMQRTLSINTVGVFLGMKAVLPSMRRAGGGSIVNVSSIAGQVGASGAMCYTASKFAVTGMTKNAAIDLGKDNIRVNSIHPGLVLTQLLLSNSEFLDRLVGRVPLGRAAQPEEISKLAMFLISDESSYCSGAEFVADGGLTCQQ